MPAFQITSPELPSAVFSSRDALLHHVAERIAYERVVTNFEVDGDECALTIDLAALGYEADEISWHVAHRGERMREMYIVAG